MTKELTLTLKDIDALRDALSFALAREFFRSDPTGRRTAKATELLDRLEELPSSRGAYVLCARTSRDG